MRHDSATKSDLERETGIALELYAVVLRTDCDVNFHVNVALFSSIAG